MSSYLMLAAKERVGKNADCILGLKYIPVVILIHFLSCLILSCYLSHLFSLPSLLSLSRHPVTKADVCTYTEVFGC